MAGELGESGSIEGILRDWNEDTGGCGGMEHGDDKGNSRRCSSSEKDGVRVGWVVVTSYMRTFRDAGIHE